jgi:ribosome-binding protein aMBF1 (putative translation factor)
MCFDENGAYRYGEEWVHIHGRTLWVCRVCADSLGRSAGIPTSAERRAAARDKERRNQPHFVEDERDA